MVTSNNNIKGLDRDTSFVHYDQSKYYDAYNFKIVTDKGSSTTSMVNERGTRLDFSIPNTQGVYKIAFINGSSFVLQENTYNISDYNSLEEIYNILLDDFESTIENDFDIYLYDSYIFVFGLNSLSLTGGAVTTVVEPLSDLRIIKLASYQDKIVVFTTNNTEANTTNGNGQIWLVDYDESTNIVNGLNGTFLVPSVHLKYNNIINLSTEHHITRAICRYESTKKATVYWTDNFNPARSFNLLADYGFAIEPSDLDFVSDITFTKPLIVDITTGGSVPSGAMVQFGYQLISAGKETIISPLSDLLPIYTSDDQNDAWVNIKGSPFGTSDNKTIVYRIDNIDENYTKIKHIAILYQFTELPIIKVFKEENIPSSRSLVVSFTNTENSTLLTEEELNMLNAQFIKCKDLAQIKNRLVAVNTLSPRFEITDEEFDARAYRFRSTGIARIKNAGSSTEVVDSTTWDVDFEHDAINPFNDDDDPDYQEYKYQSDGITLGGEGPNISYSFTTKVITLDDREEANALPYAGVSNRTEIVEDYGLNQEYSYSLQFNSFKSPFVHLLYGGYMRDEVYGFAIVFRDLKGRPSFAKWIGDIRFPSIREYHLDTYDDENLKLNANQLGIQFTVTIPQALQDKISGYEIVRMERDINNSTRLGGGLLQNLLLDNDDVRPSPNWTEIDITNHPKYVFGIRSPLLLFKDSTKFSHKIDDYVKFEFYNRRYEEELSHTEPGVDGNTGYLKLRDSQDNYYPSGTTTVIKKLRNVGRASSFNFPSQMDVSDYDDFYNESTAGVKYGQTFIASTDDDMTSATYLNITDEIIPYLTYCRKLTKQYGGNTFEERSNRVYIPTSNYVVNPDLTETFNVFGGDTYCNYFCYEDQQDPTKSGYGQSVATFFVVESPFNTDLRHGFYFNADRGVSDGTPNDPYLTYSEEKYLINDVYLQTNDIKTQYIAKPFDADTTDEQPYIIWVSEKKTNGEQIDNWVKFKPNNVMELEGEYGPINAVIAHKDRLYCYQNNGIALVPIEQQLTNVDEDGIEIVLGTGDVLSTYLYISRHTGVFHTSAVVTSEDYIYHFDIRNKKMYRISVNGKQPLSDIKGMSSFFAETFKETPLEDTDKQTSAGAHSSIHGVYDQRYNRVLFTFKVRLSVVSHTISFTELSDTFESFHGYKPYFYINTGRKMLSVDSEHPESCYQHDKGDYGVFYDRDPEESYIKYVITGQNLQNKAWTNLEWYSECYNNLNEDQPNETFESVEVSNEYQSTGSIQLSADKLRRRFRYWRHAILRDTLVSEKPRIRNPWIFVKLTKSADNNTRFIMHDLITYYME